MEAVTSSASPPDPFCDRCAASLVPLKVPHVIRACATCGRATHVVETGEGGVGIKIRTGDRFVMPAGSIRISLDPSDGGRLARAGLPFLLRHLVFAGYPKQAEDVGTLADDLEARADAILKEDPLVAHLDLDDESDGAKAFELLKEQRDSRAWHAMMLGSFAQILRKSLSEGKVDQVAWAAHNAALAHAMTVLTERKLEETLWRGYVASTVVYEAAAAASHTPGEAEAIMKLRLLFENLDEAMLHTLVESGLPIGPRIGIKSLAEPVLLALAKWHLAAFEHRRASEVRERAERRQLWELRLKWLAFGLALATAIATALVKLGVI